MLKKYLYILWLRGKNIPRLDKLYLFLFGILICFGIYQLLFTIDSIAMNLLPIPIFFIGFFLEIFFPFLVKAEEVTFISTIMKGYKSKRFLASLHLSYLLITFFLFFVFLVSLKIETVFGLFFILGIFTAFPLNRQVSKISAKKGKEESRKNIFLQKEISLFADKIYFYLYVLFYLILIFINFPILKLNFFLIFLSNFLYHDSMTLNSIGLEEEILSFLKKEKVMILSSLKAKLKFHFFIASSFFIILTLEKFLFASAAYPITLLFNLISVFILNFLFTGFLSSRFASFYGSYYKVKMSAVYLEMLVLSLYLVFIYSFWDSWLLSLVNFVLIFLLLIALNKSLRRFSEK